LKEDFKPWPIHIQFDNFVFQFVTALQCNFDEELQNAQKWLNDEVQKANKTVLELITKLYTQVKAIYTTSILQFKNSQNNIPQKDSSKVWQLIFHQLIKHQIDSGVVKRSHFQSTYIDSIPLHQITALDTREQQRIKYIGGWVI